MTTPAITAAISIAKTYLTAMEARDMARAKQLVAPQAEFIFPGGARLTDLDAIVAGSAKRYQFVGKHIESIDAAAMPDGGVAVYVRGTLHGRWLDGSAFDGIRFIDRIEVRDGLIVRQDVWNDSGEVRNAPR
jgi:ketosteroid isomerase-like protein